MPIFTEELKNWDDSKTLDDFKSLLEGVTPGNSNLFLKDGGLHPVHAVNLANERNRAVYFCIETMFALKEAIEFIKSQSRSEFDSGPKYVGEGAELLKKWGFGG